MTAAWPLPALKEPSWPTNVSQSPRLQGASDLLFLKEFLSAGASGFFLDGKCVETQSS